MDVEEGKLGRSKGWTEDGKPVAGDERHKPAVLASPQKSKLKTDRQEETPPARRRSRSRNKGVTPHQGRAVPTMLILAMVESYKIATFSFNGMAAQPRIAMLEDFLHKQEIDIIFLQEVTRLVFDDIRGFVAQNREATGGDAYGKFYYASLYDAMQHPLQHVERRAVINRLKAKIVQYNQTGTGTI